MPTVTIKNLHTLPDGEHPAADNLFLRVRGKSRVFIFRYVSPVDGSRRKLSIGPVTRMPLPEARNEAARCRLLLAKGIDPKAARDALAQRDEPEPQPEEVTFGDFWRPVCSVNKNSPVSPAKRTTRVGIFDVIKPTSKYFRFNACY